MTIGVISIVVLTVVFVLVQRQQKNSKQAAETTSQTNLTPYTPNPDSLTERDSDGDGLKDWEEVLWHTDPHNKDTDGDGASDYDEILAGRDPTIPGPNDKLKTNETATSTTPAANENLTATERLGREFFANFLAAQQSGIPITQDSMQGDMQTLVANTALLLNTKKYTVADAHIISDNSKNALRTYGNALGDIAIRYTPKNDPGENEIGVLNLAVQNKKYAELQKLDPKIEAVTKTLEGAVALPVPETIAPLHIHLLNTMSDYKEMLRGIRAAEDDPVRALIAVGNNQKDLIALAGAIRDIGRYFIKQGIDFGTKEGGYIFVKSL